MIPFKVKSIHHIKLTVANLGISAIFYENIIGLSKVAEYKDFVMLSNGKFYLGLTKYENSNQLKFSEKNIGLDHVSFEVESEAALKRARELLSENNIKHGEIQQLTNGLFILPFRDPDNIQLEFCYKP